MSGLKRYDGLQLEHELRRARAWTSEFLAMKMGFDLEEGEERELGRASFLQRWARKFPATKMGSNLEEGEERELG